MKKVAVGVDIGGTNSAYGLVDEQGNILSEGVFPTRNFPDSDLYIEELYIGIQNLLKTAGEEYELIGVGIGAPNGNFYKGTIEFAPNLPWKGTVNLVEKMKRFFPTLPVIVTNDANAAAVGEMVYGGARGMKDFLVVTLGTGLGSGFVANGQFDLRARRFRRRARARDGQPYGARLRMRSQRMSRNLCFGDRDQTNDFQADGRQHRGQRIPACDVYRPDCRNDYQSGAQRRPLAIEAYEYTGMLLGRALADAVSITSPEAIFLFGGLAKAGKYIFEPTKKYMEMNMMPIFRNKVKLLPSGIDGKNAAVLGASALAWQHVQNKG